MRLSIETGGYLENSGTDTWAVLQRCVLEGTLTSTQNYSRVSPGTCPYISPLYPGRPGERHLASSTRVPLCTLAQDKPRIIALLSLTMCVCFRPLWKQGLWLQVSASATAYWSEAHHLEGLPLGSVTAVLSCSPNGAQRQVLLAPR